jgi:hypothetical protein
LVLETDASNYACAAVLSHLCPDGSLWPIAFHSQSFKGAKLNYDVHDKELLAIFNAFCIWQHYLEGTPKPVDVLTNHKNLEYFATTKLLTRRQAWWSKYLSAFNMMICYQPGKEGGKPDALTRCWDMYSLETGTYRTGNPQNLWPIFDSAQLLVSLWATQLVEKGYVALQTVDLDSLYN